MNFDELKEKAWESDPNKKGTGFSEWDKATYFAGFDAGVKAERKRLFTLLFPFKAIAVIDSAWKKLFPEIDLSTEPVKESRMIEIDWSKVKPCPKCLSKALDIENKDIMLANWYIYCLYCFYEGLPALRKDLSEKQWGDLVVENWNEEREE